MSTRTLIAGTLLLLCGACSDHEAPAEEGRVSADAEGDDRSDALAFFGNTGADTGTTSSAFIDWNTLTFSYQMGFDEVTRQPASVFLDLGTGLIEIPPTMDLHLGDAAWSGDLAQTNLYCTVTFPLVNADSFLTNYDPTRLILGFEQNPGEASITDCFDGVPGDLDPLYGTDFDTYLHTYGQWGVAVGGTEAYTASLISPYLTGPLLPQHLIGGTMRMGAFFSPPTVDEVFGFAWEMDAVTFEVATNAGSLIPEDAADIEDVSGALIPAWYDVSSLYIYTFY